MLLTLTLVSVLLTLASCAVAFQGAAHMDADVNQLVLQSKQDFTGQKVLRCFASNADAEGIFCLAMAVDMISYDDFSFVSCSRLSLNVHTISYR